MTDPIRGENPIRAKQRKKENCLTAEIYMNLSIEIRSPTTLQPLKSWKKFESVVASIEGTIEIRPFCQTYSCEGRTGFLGFQPDCEERMGKFNEELFASTNILGKKLETQFALKVGCCSKKCSKKDNGRGETSTFPVQFIETVTAQSAFTGIVGQSGDDFLGVYGRRGINPDKYADWLNQIGGAITGNSISIDPGGILDQNFKRPCGE